jgi:methyl-accepting chemotaxis protein
MKVATRLSLGFGSVIGLLIIIAALGINNISRIQDDLDGVVYGELPKVVWANNILNGVSAIGILMRDSLLVTGREDIQKELDGILEERKNIKNNLDRLQSAIAVSGSDSDRALLAKVTEARLKYIDAQETFLQLMHDGKQEAARKYLMETAMELQDRYIAALNEMSAYQTSESRRVGDAANNRVEMALSMIFSVAFVALLSAVLIGIMIVRSLMKQLGGEPDYAADVMRKVAEGDLSVQVQIRSGDANSLLFALHGMVEKLSGLIIGVRGASDAINVATRDIAQGNSELSQRTEEQATSLEEASSSMQEVTLTVKQSAESAMQANQLAASASDIAVKGGQAMEDVVRTMVSISDSSSKIVDIISVINSISFQTNILALNAAVEAARAGEQGRGFAVVANEVRNLSQRSAAAAREIKALIDDSVSKVDAGSKQVFQAGATMEEIVRAVKRVTDIMAEIADASSEQSSAIEQVNQAIIQVDEVTQQNAAMVEEATAAAESMREQAGVLMTASGVFKLKMGNRKVQDAVPGVLSPATEGRTENISAKPVVLATERRKRVRRQLLAISNTAASGLEYASNANAGA